MADDVPYLDVAGVRDEAAGSGQAGGGQAAGRQAGGQAGGTVTFFAVNRHPTRGLRMAVSLQGFATAPRILDHQVMTHPDLRITNTLAHPNRVAPRPGQGAAVDEGSLTATLPPHSWQMIRLQA